MVLSGKSNVKNLIRSDDSFLVSVFSNVVYVAGPPTWVYFFNMEHIDFHFRTNSPTWVYFFQNRTY